MIIDTPLEERVRRLEEIVIKQWKFIDAIIEYLRDKDPDFKLLGLDLEEKKEGERKNKND